MKKEAGKSAMSGKRKKKSGVNGMHVRRGAAGGYIAKHDSEPMSADDMASGAPAPQPQEFPLADQAALQTHMAEHMPDQAAAPGPATGGAPGM